MVMRLTRAPQKNRDAGDVHDPHVKVDHHDLLNQAKFSTCAEMLCVRPTACALELSNSKFA